MVAYPVIVSLWVSDGIHRPHRLLTANAQCNPSLEFDNLACQLDPPWVGQRIPIWIRLDVSWSPDCPPLSVSEWESWFQESILKKFAISLDTPIQSAKGSQGMRLWVNRIPEACSPLDLLESWILRRLNSMTDYESISAPQQLRWLLSVVQLEIHNPTPNSIGWLHAMAIARHIVATKLNSQHIHPDKQTVLPAGAEVPKPSDVSLSKKDAAVLLVALSAISVHSGHDVFRDERAALNALLGNLSTSAIQDWRAPQLYASVLLREDYAEDALIAKADDLLAQASSRSFARLWVLAALLQQAASSTLVSSWLERNLLRFLKPLKSSSLHLGFVLASSLFREKITPAWWDTMFKKLLRRQCQPYQAIAYDEPLRFLGGFPSDCRVRRYRSDPSTAPLAALLMFQSLEY